MKKLAISLLAILSLASLASAQVALTSTTLSAAVAVGDTVLTVASATGITAPSGLLTTTLLFVDKELMRVTAVSSTTITVVRGEQSSVQAHVSGALVYAGDPSYFKARGDKMGACTSTTELVLPVINVTNGRIYDCRSSGQWIRILDGTMTSGAAGTIRAHCTGTAGSAETEFLNNAACSGATTSTTRFVAATYGTLANLRVTLSAAGAGGANKDVITVRKNGSDSSLTVTTGTTACATAAAAACIDQSHSVAVAPGDVITFKFVSDTSDTAANVAAVVEVF